MSTGSLSGQGGRPPGSVVGRVLDAETNRPVAAADLILPELGLRTATDNRGRFEIEDVPPGTHALQVRHLGYGELEREVDVPSSYIRALTIRLVPRAVAVTPLEVEIERELRLPWLDRRGFYLRREMGFGEFFGPEYLTRWFGLRTADVAQRAAGSATVGHRRRGGQRLVFARSRHRCSGAMFYVDGHRWGVRIPDLPASEIAAMEVYRGPSQGAGSLIPVGRCGAVFIWTWRGPNPFR